MPRRWPVSAWSVRWGLHRAALRELLRGNVQRRNMGEAARRLGRPEAAAAIVDDLCAWLEMPTDGAASDDGAQPLPAADFGPWKTEFNGFDRWAKNRQELPEFVYGHRL